jgi:hypothetical protein
MSKADQVHHASSASNGRVGKNFKRVVCETADALGLALTSQDYDHGVFHWLVMQLAVG